MFTYALTKKDSLLPIEHGSKSAMCIEWANLNYKQGVGAEYEVKKIQIVSVEPPLTKTDIDDIVDELYTGVILKCRNTK